MSVVWPSAAPTILAVGETFSVALIEQGQLLVCLLVEVSLAPPMADEAEEVSHGQEQDDDDHGLQGPQLSLELMARLSVVTRSAILHENELLATNDRSSVHLVVHRVGLWAAVVLDQLKAEIKPFPAQVDVAD